MKLETLVTTMHQTGFDLYTRMNLQTDAVIANQTDQNSYAEAWMNGYSVKMVSTDTRGLSRNRNLALAHASQCADCVLFTDDDLVFADGYERMIAEEFEKHPEAEAIRFNIHELPSSRRLGMRRIERFERATRRNMSASGVCGVVVKNEVLKRHNLRFHESFGAGTENYCGEDTLFLMQMLDRRVRLYRSPVDIAGIHQASSSWYRGANEAYFTIAGAVLGEAYPKTAYLIALRSALKARRRKRGRLSFWRVLACYYRGIRTGGYSSR